MRPSGRRERPPFADPPPVVVITRNHDEGLSDECIALGARRYFRKPLDSDALLEAARELVEPAVGGTPSF